MSFQAIGPEEPKERGPKLAVQDRDTSSLFASAERSRGRPGTEVRTFVKKNCYQVQFSSSKYTKMRLWLLGIQKSRPLRPRLHWGAYSAPLDP